MPHTIDVCIYIFTSVVSENVADCKSATTDTYVSFDWICNSQVKLRRIENPPQQNKMLRIANPQQRVICSIKYITKKDNKEVSQTAELEFYANSSQTNEIRLDYPAERIVSIEIWGAKCKSASRPW